MSEVKAKPVVTAFSKEKYNEAVNVQGKRVIEVADIAAFDMPLSAEGQSFDLIFTGDARLIVIDKPVGQSKEDGRIIVIAGTGRNDKGAPYSFGMRAEQAETLKKGDKVQVIAVRNATTDRCRLQLV